VIWRSIPSTFLVALQLPDFGQAPCNRRFDDLRAGRRPVLTLGHERLETPANVAEVPAIGVRRALSTLLPPVDPAVPALPWHAPHPR